MQCAEEQSEGRTSSSVLTWKGIVSSNITATLEDCYYLCELCPYSSLQHFVDPSALWRINIDMMIVLVHTGRKLAFLDPYCTLEFVKNGAVFVNCIALAPHSAN